MAGSLIFGSSSQSSGADSSHIATTCNRKRHKTSTPARPKHNSLFSVENQNFISRSPTFPVLSLCENANSPGGFRFSVAPAKQNGQAIPEMDDLAYAFSGAKLAGHPSKTAPVSSSDLSALNKSKVHGPRGFADESEDEDEDAQETAEAVEAKEHAQAALKSHLRLLARRADLEEINEVKTTPLFSEPVRRHALSVSNNVSASERPFTQFGLLAGVASGDGESIEDPRLFYNVSAPSSVFICGSQGSGKSHSLSVLLENCLIKSEANELPRPLTAVVFHYDTFTSDSGGSPCEAAWLSSNPAVNVRVLCAPTNYTTIKKLYTRFPRIKIEELRFNQTDLNTKRMLDLMAVTSGGHMPLYLHVASRILRDMRITQQRQGLSFSYAKFKQLLEAERLTKEQLAPLKQRLDTLESFMLDHQAKEYDMFGAERRGFTMQNAVFKKEMKSTSWQPMAAQLTIVDLSCPCVTADNACSLFNICLSLFLEQDASVGRVIALDEAHKYMTDSSDCQALTDSLLETIRLQRHLGTRVIISTQEPTISPKLMDLCSVTLVHRFTSPDWLNALKKHLAGVSSASKLLEKTGKLIQLMDEDDTGGKRYEGMRGLSLGSEDVATELFCQIVGLRVGEALMFAPSAVVGVQMDAKGQASVRRLAHGVLKVRVRNRVTADGGRSIMAA